MRTFTDDEILKRVLTLPSFGKGFPKGVMDVWVRSRADQFNLFDDKAFTYDCTGDTPVFVMARAGTTNAGSYGLLHFNEYNRDGCAVLKSDEIVYDSHRYGLHKGKPAYVQAKPFPFYRDGNHNRRAEEIGPLQPNEIIGANVHRAGFNSTVINNWSTGCLVTQKLSEFLDFMTFMHKRPFLTVCILKEF